MHNISCFVPSLITYNAKALDATAPSMDINERINWLNSQQSDKSAYPNTHNIVSELSKVSSDSKTQISTVREHTLYLNLFTRSLEYVYKYSM